MNFFEKIIYFFQGGMEKPLPYGLWHIMSIVIVIGLCVLLGFLMRNSTNKGLRIFLIVTSVILMVMELIKQGVFCMQVEDGVATWTFQWYIFPFQFCSTPMYIGLIAGIAKPGKFQDALLSFLATFAIVAGAIVMIVPTDVFTGWIFINFQTMFYHGAMLVMATIILAGKHVRLEFKTILKGAIVFAICVALALAMNIAYAEILGTERTFNMFYISPYFDCSMPVFDVIYQKVPYIVFLLLYLVAFVGGTCLVMYAIKFFTWLVSKIKRV